ncbi:hypothetical protein QIG45_27555, partial [Klebsiella pneumoniae]|nr:hypothetical protein [Klebsiella pneumoniae]
AKKTNAQTAQMLRAGTACIREAVKRGNTRNHISKIPAVNDYGKTIKAVFDQRCTARIQWPN